VAESAVRVNVEGIKEFQAALRQIDATLPRRMRVANNVVAEKLAAAARLRAGSLGSTAAHVAPSVRVASDQRSVAIKIGSAKYPMAIGAEFGSHRFHQFKPWTGNKWTDPESLAIGYFLHPTIRAEVSAGHVRDEYDKAMAELAAIAFPK
jgi:hypothetical protein